MSSLTAGGGGGFGPLGWIIGVLIIVVCFGGGVWYFFTHSRGQHGLASADDLNPQPLPPKGMGDGSSQFAKIEDGSDQYRKAWDQFDKDSSSQIGSDGGLTGNEIGGSGGDQLDKI